MIEYFSKLRSITDELSITRSLFSSLDFITHLFSRLRQPYYLVVVYIKANVLKMSMYEPCSMLLTDKSKLESS